MHYHPTIDFIFFIYGCLFQFDQLLGFVRLYRRSKLPPQKKCQVLKNQVILKALGCTFSKHETTIPNLFLFHNINSSFENMRKFHNDSFSLLICGGTRNDIKQQNVLTYIALKQTINYSITE